MTNAEIDALFRSNLDISHLAALRAIWNAGYFAGAGITPTASTPDQSRVSAAPTVKLKVTKPD